MLTDTGVLVALLDKRDPRHSDCLAAARRLPPIHLLTSWPCFTEAMYLLGKVGGYRYQETLWAMRRQERLVLLDLTASEASLMNDLMRKYQNVPMDLADASLMALAESRRFRILFTLDSDFYVYRCSDGTALEVHP